MMLMSMLNIGDVEKGLYLKSGWPKLNVIGKLTVKFVKVTPKSRICEKFAWGNIITTLETLSMLTLY